MKTNTPTSILLFLVLTASRCLASSATFDMILPLEKDGDTPIGSVLTRVKVDFSQTRSLWKTYSRTSTGEIQENSTLVALHARGWDYDRRLAFLKFELSPKSQLGNALLTVIDSTGQVTAEDLVGGGIITVYFPNDKPECFTSLF